MLTTTAMLRTRTAAGRTMQLLAVCFALFLLCFYPGPSSTTTTTVGTGVDAFTSSSINKSYYYSAPTLLPTPGHRHPNRRSNHKNQNQNNERGRSHSTGSSSSRTIRSTVLFASTLLPDGYQEYGEDIIRQAAHECGMVLLGTEEENETAAAAAAAAALPRQRLEIEWKAGRIIVTVHGENIQLSSIDGSSTDDNEEEEDEAAAGEKDHGEDDLDSNEDDVDDDEDIVRNGVGAGPIDLSLFARTINRLLDDENRNDAEEEEEEDKDKKEEDPNQDNSVSIGARIAEVFAIEVTTPGVADELLEIVKTHGPEILNAYRGFDVIVKQYDKNMKPKKKKKKTGGGASNEDKIKTIEGKLVERTAEHTIINIKGRMKKLKNETVLSLKLPKAKKEKGSQ